MAYSVLFGPALAHVPAEVMATVRERMHEIAWTVGALPESRVDSMSASPMRLHVDGWEFTYWVEPKARRIRVLTALPPRPNNS
jgi:hypothetical protein